MTALFVVVLLAAPPVTAVPVMDRPVMDRGVAGAEVFERMKKLEGNWKSKEGHTLSVRVTASGRAVVTSLMAVDRSLESVTVFRLEGGELQGAFDGASHGVLRLQGASELLVKLEARPDGAKSPVVALSLAIPDADNLVWSVTTRAGPKDEEASTDFAREYVETLK